MNGEYTYTRPVFRWEAITPHGAKLATVVRVLGPDPELVLKFIETSRLAKSVVDRLHDIPAPEPLTTKKSSSYVPTPEKVASTRAALRSAQSARKQLGLDTLADMPSGEKLAEWRTQAGMSQRDVAKQLGVARGAYAMVEKNTRKSPDLRIRAATLFNKKRGIDW